MMFSTNPLPPPTDHECTYMRNWAIANNNVRTADWRDFWVKANSCPGAGCASPPPLGP